MTQANKQQSTSCMVATNSIVLHRSIAMTYQIVLLGGNKYNIWQQIGCRNNICWHQAHCPSYCVTRKQRRTARKCGRAPHFNTYCIARWQLRPHMSRCADGSNNNILCYAMATTTTSCASTRRRPTATTYHIVLRDGNDNHMCAV